MSKDHFYFNRNDRIVALLLLAVIVGANTVSHIRQGMIEKARIENDTISLVSDTPAYQKRYAPPRVKDTIRTIVRTKRIYIKDTVYRYNSHQDSVRTGHNPSKTRPESPLDLNMLDSTDLIKLPGIGPYFASKIITYREQLGGYTRTSQLTEINGLPDSLMKWFIIVDTVPLRRILVNHETVAELRRHPYLNFYQARAIVEFRRERGKITGPEQLSFLEEFTAQDLNILLPYLDFR
ncbi:MAG: helix-hairpin-helix domain-containing protein [Bacteroidaceae bacterium]|nr:helix-hairpin-helix domain-containing protein [Bacteroidaceae bacterium]